MKIKCHNINTNNDLFRFHLGMESLADPSAVRRAWK